MVNLPLIALLSLPVLARAVEAPPAVLKTGAGTDWVEDDARGKNPADPGSVDRDRFREGFQNNTLDNICRLARLAADLKLGPGGILGVQIGARRSLRRYADGKLALIDETPVRFSLGYARGFAEFSGKATTGAFFSASFDGASTVVLPVKDSSCKALRKLLNPLQFKSVVPLSGFKNLVAREDFAKVMAARIAAMEIGEVWKLPVKPSVGWGPSLTVPVGEASFHAHWTMTTSRGESVSLKRLSADEVRFRLRIDTIKASDKGLGAAGAITAEQLGIADKFVYSRLVSLFNQYFHADVTADKTNAKGREVVLEYVLNPNDPAQMEALVRAAAGDISVLDTIKQMLHKTDRLLASDENIREGLERLRDEHDDELGSEATFAAGDAYERPSERFHVHLPFLFRLDASRADSGRERVVLLDDKGGEIRLYPAEKRVARGFAEVPVLGDLDRYEKSLGVQVYTYKDLEGGVGTANAVFIEQRAFTREGPWTPNGMLEGVNGVMRYAGMKGAGVDARKELPLTPFRATAPPSPALHSPRAAGEPPSVQGYEKGMSAFTLILSRKAIQDILAAAPDAVARACANAGLGASRAAGAISADLAKARDALNPDAQAAAVRDLLAGAGKSGLGYDEVLKVLIQFVEPADAAAIVEIDVKTSGREPRVRKRYLLNPEGAETGLVRSYAEARARFLTPSLTND